MLKEILERKRLIASILKEITEEYLTNLNSKQLERTARFVSDLWDAMVVVVVKHLRFEKKDKSTRIITPIGLGDAHDHINAVIEALILKEKEMVFRGECSCGRTVYRTKVESVGDAHCECGKPVAMLPTWRGGKWPSDDGQSFASALQTPKLS